MEFHEAMAEYAPDDLVDMIDALGGTGRGGGTRLLAERWAEVNGKSVKTNMRSIQRALKAAEATGEPAQLPRSLSEAAATAGRQAAGAAVFADMVDERAVVDIGRVGVKSKSPRTSESAGSRYVGMPSLNTAGKDALKDAARKVTMGDRAGAMVTAGEAVMKTYQALRGNDDVDLPNLLEVTNFEKFDLM